MQNGTRILVAAALVAMSPTLPTVATAADTAAPWQLAMMDMMPPAGAAMPAAPRPAPGGALPGTTAAPASGAAMPGMSDDGKMRGGPGAMPSPSAQGAGPGCGMMEMMQTMMRGRPGAAGMPAMSGAAPAAVAPGAMPSAGGTRTQLEDRIAALRASLHVTDGQAAAWDVFAAALRVGRGHLDAAREALLSAGDAADPMARLQGYEDHLVARAEAIRMTRLAFNAMFGQLDDAQKRVATATMLPFIGMF